MFTKTMFVRLGRMSREKERHFYSGLVGQVMVNHEG
jgi:hypothetical protein